MLALQLRMLGRFEARGEGGQKLTPPGRQSVALLACLAMPEDGPRTRQELARLIWHDRGPEQAAASLRVELARLRKAFGRGLLENADAAGASMPALNLEVADVDVRRFEEAVAVPGRAQEASTLYRGRLLADFPSRERDAFSAWLEARRQLLDRQAASALLRLLRGAEATEAIARRLLRLDPLCEEAWRYLIRHNGTAGEPGRAWAAYEECMRTLAAQGHAPSAETRALAELVRDEAASSVPNVFRIVESPGEPASPDWVRALRHAPAPRVGQTVVLPIIDDRPSIAVLPFRDLSPQGVSDPWLARGLTEEVTNALARMPGLFVSSLRSVEAIAAKPADIRLVAAQLGVRYLVEASVDRDGSGLRSTLRLIDGRTGMHLWADAVEAGVETGLRLRDAIVREIAGRLQPRLISAEITRALSDPPGNQHSWGLGMQAVGLLPRALHNPADMLEATSLLERAIALEPHFAMAHAMLSAVFTWQAIGRLTPASWRSRWRARRHMDFALRLEPENSFVLTACAETALYAAGDMDRAMAMLEAALQRDPNNAQALALLGHVRRMAGEAPEAALALIERAMRLSPRDPRSSGWHHAASWCYWRLGDWERMASSARRSLELARRFPWGWVALTCALGLQERWAEARAAGEVVRELMPQFSGFSFYVMARVMYARRFHGETKHGYAQLRSVLDRALAGKEAASTPE